MLSCCLLGRRCNVNTCLIATCWSQTSPPVYRWRQHQRPALVRLPLTSLGEGEQEQGLHAAPRGHTNYHACPCGRISFQRGRAKSLPELQLFPCGQEVFGLAADQDWGKIPRDGSVCQGWEGCSPPCAPSPGAVNQVVVVFLIHPSLPFFSYVGIFVVIDAF